MGQGNCKVAFVRVCDRRTDVASGHIASSPDDFTIAMDSVDAKAADVDVDITQASPLVVGSQPSWRNTLRVWWRVARTAFSYTPLAFLLARLVHILAPTPTERSSYNNLHFAFAPDGSPLRLDGRYPVKITAGVLPKRFHAHNDCMFLILPLPFRSK
jgi:hypothetical protein